MSLTTTQQSMSPEAHALEAWRMLMGIGQAARVSSAQPAVRAAIPFTLLAGFLGSGKTTLLRNVLAAPSTARIAALVNDFGSINIDAALVRSRTRYAIELANGCVCCDLSMGLADALAEQLARSEPPDAIILEASGIAEPLGILHVALSNPGLRLGGVITVIDAETLAARIDDPLTAALVERQISAADILVINKVDLAGPSGVAASREVIRRIAADVRIVEATYAEVPTQIVLDTRLHETALVATHATSLPRHGFDTWAFTSERMLDPARVCSLASELPDAIFRAKGLILSAQDPTAPYLLQVVGKRWSLTKEGAWSDAERRSQIVFIARSGSDALRQLEAALRSCEVADPPMT